MIIKTNDYTPTFLTEPKENNITMFSDLVKLDRGNLICIAARPGMFKTSLAVYMALEFAKRSNKAVCIFALEFGIELMQKKLISLLAGVPLRVMRNKSFSEEQAQAIENAKEQLKKLNIIIEGDCGLSVSQIEEKLKQIDNLGMIIIDYIQLMTSESRFDNRIQEISEISRKLKFLTKRKNIPVIVTSQLLRKIEWREDKRPRLDDIRDVGAIEQDSDTIILIHIENSNIHELNEFPYQEPREAEIMIAKNRYGSTGNVLLDWRGQYTKFSELDKEV